jgi:hexosaminidase
MLAVVTPAAAALALSPAARALPTASAPAVSSAAHHRDSRPQTIPALRQWHGTAGKWRVERSSRIVVGRRRHGLSRDGHLLARDLRAVLHRRLPVVRVAPRAAGAGDIALRVRPSMPGLRGGGYRMRVGMAIHIEAPRRLGAFYAGRTLIQLLRQHPWVRRGVARDRPTYRQRGLMVDCGRTAYSTGWMIREIRELALLKFNVLHLHLTDDQRWGVASKAFPGVVSPDAFSYRDIRRILRVAHRYHVRVFPEIDMPGHMAAFLAKHPDLELKPLLVGGSNPPQQYLTDKLDITNPVVLRDVKKMVLEYLRLFPGRYFDMGDDEVLVPPDVAVFPQLEAYAVQKYGVGATASDALHGFINWVDGIVRRHGRTLRVWNDQLGGTVRVPVRHDIAVDWWTGVSPLSDPFTVAPRTLLDRGFRILNAGWYPNYYASDIGPASGKSPMAKVYREWHVYEFDSVADKSGHQLSVQHVPAHDPRVLGDAMSIWGPLPETTAQTQRRIARRLAVIAQKTWNTPLLTTSYSRFERLMARVGVT